MKSKFQVIVLLQLMLASCIVFAQDVPTKKHIISVAPFNLLNSTVSLKYSTQLTNNLAFIVNPSVRVQLSEKLSNSVLGFSDPDPFWYYEKFKLRVGIMRHNKTFFIEPLIQYEYAYFKNQMLQTVDGNGDAFDEDAKLDRSYNSIGLISLFGIKHNIDYLNIKYYLGAGLNSRFYNETIYTRYYENSTTTYDPPEHNVYFKEILSIYGGIEIGVRF